MFPHRSPHFRTLSLSAACVALLVASSPAQTPCFASSGPDVIVGDITGVANYAPSNGVEALGVGTTLCNIGPVWLDYFATTNRHPLNSSGIFRLKQVAGADRFEQLGLSWLHHGFFALSSGLCCSCTPTDGTHLGIGCSDPSTASRQGAQTGLGPRWQVNAHTGDFPYPPANPPWSGSVARRLQVRVADLEVTGGPGSPRFFAEKSVIAPDDAAALNGNNNASWRELTATENAGNWTFGITGSTTRESPAIRAWADLDPGVQEVDLQVPSEGLFILAYEATDLGGGQWHYEFALYNMNSDLSGQSFSVPIPAGVTPTNIGFHDVDHHDGDGIGNVDSSGVDWTATLAGGALTWECETFAQNPNGNALRWGSLYNFRFDAPSPPTMGNVTVGFFKSPGSIGGAAAVPAGTTGTAYCAGDGTDPLVTTDCPCLNFGAAGRGCANSQNASGAALTAAGSTTPDTVVMTSEGELPASLSIFVQGDANQDTGIVFGDGVRCFAGHLKRLYVKNASGGTAIAPQGGDPSITARSAALGDPIPVGGTRYYGVYYRDPSATFCPAPAGSTFNVGNGVSIVWL